MKFVHSGGEELSAWPVSSHSPGALREMFATAAFASHENSLWEHTDHQWAAPALSRIRPKTGSPTSPRGPRLREGAVKAEGPHQMTHAHISCAQLGQGGTHEVGKLGSDHRWVPGGVQRISLSPDWSYSKAKLLVEVKHLPFDGQCTA
uniref:Uncharacterized protein n=1 Tax=Pipistrellus kuhlii TaxID=59472 RepID=A0A7J7WLK8_PIPKU|nr:hypothetical protein mPipKuh1_007974 [Pipistrellus kuhlii]